MKALRLRETPALERYGRIEQELQMSWSRSRTHRVHLLLWLNHAEGGQHHLMGCSEQLVLERQDYQFPLTPCRVAQLLMSVLPLQRRRKL